MHYCYNHMIALNTSHSLSSNTIGISLQIIINEVTMDTPV